MDPPTISSILPPGASLYPPRRRVWQACTNCRARKTRCDAGKPRCGLCTTQNVECVYVDSQQPRIEHNTLLLLERIQMLEDRLLASPNFSGPQAAGPVHAPGSATAGPAPHDDASGRPDAAAFGQPAAPTEIPISLSHTANANHVLNWPIVQELLSSAPARAQEPRPTEATAIFFRQASAADETSNPPSTWRLFEDSDGPDSRAETAEGYLDLIHAYFDEVNVFYPLLSRVAAIKTLEGVVAADPHGEGSPSTAGYCVLLLVLCMGSFVRQGKNRISLLSRPGEDTAGFGSQRSLPFDEHLWRKAQLLLGCVSSAITVEAAQCTMLASIYMGARARVPDSFHWSHVTSVKCATLLKRMLLDPQDPSTLPEALRRLYWVAFIHEGDFMSEISVTLPSGIARYEDQVPYPTRVSSTDHQPLFVQPAGGGSAPGQDDDDELVAFQISTNAAIRRLLNRVHSMVYDIRDQPRLTRVEYVHWLLRVSGDFRSYHDTVYRSIPRFLLVSRPAGADSGNNPSARGPGLGLGNNPWNVIRLEGRRHAAQHIIHRPFFDYVLLNMAHVPSHPDRDLILEKCALCLEGCAGFFDVFDVEEVNSITSLFATGMATFTYLVILRVATLYPIFRHVLPADVERAIWTGKRNLQRFSVSVADFAWHLDLLERIDAACRQRLPIPG